LNYGCYLDSRFMLVATPSGITLAPEGGAHQSISTPLIGMGQPGLQSYEPAFADELQVIMAHGFKYMQLPKGEGGSIYLRLTTRNLEQPERQLTTEQRDFIIKGGYWRSSDPTASSEIKLVIVFCGVLSGEVMDAYSAVCADLGEKHVAVLQVTSPDNLANEWQSSSTPKHESHIEKLLVHVPRSAKIVSVIDGHPTSLSWIGAVKGNETKGLGVTTFGQSGDLVDLYRHYELDTQAIVESCRGIMNL
jgi:pyruvate dehydrogenase E1 component